MKKNNKGFTLVELLAVIVILGLLMAIAIPSVTKYITQSRKKTLVSTMDSYVTAVTNAVNDNEFGPLSKQDTIYYIPVSNDENESCVSLEKGGTNPFGNWKEAYVAVNYDADKYSYDYYFTFYDDAGYGMELTEISKVGSGSMIQNPTPVNADNITGQINDRASNIKILNTDTCNVANAVNGTVGGNNAVTKSCISTGYDIGDLVTCGSENFYIISNDSSSITALSKYPINPNVNNPIQNASASSGTYFANRYYWKDTITAYPAFVFDSNSPFYQYVKAYETYLRNNLGVENASTSLISIEQLNALGCSNRYCDDTYPWIFPQVSYYYTGSALSSGGMVATVQSDGQIYTIGCANSSPIRTVVTIPKNEINFK